jgi:hypothetical protein
MEVLSLSDWQSLEVAKPKFVQKDDVLASFEEVSPLARTSLHSPG